MFLARKFDFVACGLQKMSPALRAAFGKVLDCTRLDLIADLLE